MARRPRLDVAGGIYHVVARGNERKAIFRDARDRHAYIDRLQECRERFRFFVLAFCLMDNHVHLALQRGAVSLSRVMLALHSSYSQRFNRRYRRIGHLFQGRYSSFLVQTDRYFLALLRYIHFNPVEAGLVSSPEGYRWSSDRYYRAGVGPAWLDLDRGLHLLGRKPSEAVARYRRLVGASDATGYESIDVLGGRIKGEKEFAARSLMATGEPPRNWRLPTIEELAETVASAEGVTVRELQRVGQSSRESAIRAVVAYVGKSQAGISIARVARFFGRDDSTLVKGVKRLESRLRSDETLRLRISAIASRLAGALEEPRPQLEPRSSGIQD